MNEPLRKTAGCLVPTFFSEENMRIMKEITLRPDDIILVTYPKCGTNWTSYIIWSILHPKEPAPEAKRVTTDFPFVDLAGLGRWTETPEDQGRTLVTHLSYESVAKSKSAKYVIIIRNPLDCCVSMYHFSKKLFDKGYTEDGVQEIPDAYFEDFVNGNVPYGDYFEHTKAWYAQEKQPNVHLMVFEKMKENPGDEILRLAKFLGRDKILEDNDGQLLDKIVEQSSFGVMKSTLKYTNPAIQGEIPILRKGQAGGYKDSLTPRQIEILKEKMDKELQGTEILDYWRKV